MKPEEEKKILRQKMTVLRDGIPSNHHIGHSNLICDRVYNLVMKEEYKIVHSYLPFRSEINVLPCLAKLKEKGVKIICPKTMKDGVLVHLELLSTEQVDQGLYGAPYPAGNTIYTGPLDLIIAPGLAFDEEGNRLGYGGGYYDRFLLAHPEATKIGVCFSSQIVEKVPIESWDIVLDDIYFTAL